MRLPGRLKHALQLRAIQSNVASIHKTLDRQRSRGDWRRGIGNVCNLEDAMHDGVLRDIRERVRKERQTPGRAPWEASATKSTSLKASNGKRVASSGSGGY